MLKNFLKKLAIITLELVLISGALWYVIQKRGVEKPAEIIPFVQRVISQKISGSSELLPELVKTPFPEVKNDAQYTFTWQYKGVKYVLTENLDSGVDAYYQNSPKTLSYVGQLQPGWEDKYYGMFLESNPADSTMNKLANDLQVLGKKHGLSDDQIVELTLAFVQAIPYDDARAKNILAKTGNEQLQYPYETLFKKSGVCSDKSLLATALLRQLGYGVTLLAYEDDNHMAIGVACPKEFSTYGSGYCYAETTSVGNKIGIIPNFDAASNKTVGGTQLSQLSSDQLSQVRLAQLGQATFLQQTQGKEYLGIIQTKNILAEIDSLKKTLQDTLPTLQVQKKQLLGTEKQLQNMQDDLKALEKAQKYEKYNSLVGDYNSLLEQYQQALKKYNKAVGLYNKTIQRYNTLISQ